LTALTPVIIAAKFSFPYVTVRTVFFRLAIELCLLLVLYLAARGMIDLGKERPPKRSFFRNNYFFWAFSGLLAVEIIAAFFGQSPVISFMSDLERMWGIFTVLHLFLFYILIRSFFQEKDWRIFINIFLVVSLLVSLYGIIQRYPAVFKIYLFEAGIGRITSTLGNPTYVAIYLLFALAFALYCLRENWRRPSRYFYLAVLVIDFFAFILTEIRGAYLGLLAGLGLVMILYFIFGGNKKYKYGLAAVLTLGILFLGLAFLRPESRLVQRLPIIKNLATISFSATTAQTRLMSWNAAWQGIKERPVLGAGMENFNIIFNKYFKAGYYDLAPSETFFDRAHNQFLNLTAESGILALLIYLGFPLVIGCYLIGGYRQGRFKLFELSLFSAMALAYFTHVFFVFDDINSFLFFLVLIAFIEFRYHQDNLVVIRDDSKSAGQPNNFAIVSLVLLALAVIYCAYNFNYKVLQAAHLSALAYMSSGFGQTIDYYNQTLDLNIIQAENVAVNYGDYLTDLSTKLDQIKADKNNSQLFSQAMARVHQAFEREIKLKPADGFLYMKLAKINNLEYLFYDDKKCLDQAVANLNISLDLSPERLQIFYILGESYVIGGDNKKAIEILNKAVQLNPSFNASYYYLGRAYLTNGELDRAYDYIINQAIGEGGYKPQNNLILLALARELVDKKGYQRVIKVYQAILKHEPNNSDIMAALAAVYLQVDDYDKAIQTAEQAAALNPALAEETKIFVDLIKSGQIDRLKQSIK
jgi:O-antigen ligase/cytochrome c-type biogenesis protein CcmH/NrfG